MDGDSIYIEKRLEIVGPASEVEWNEIIANSPNKSCHLDALLNWLFA